MKTRQSTESSLTDLSDSNGSLRKSYLTRRSKTNVCVDIPIIAFINVHAYGNAKKALHVSSVPEKLLGREMECNELYSHLEVALKTNSGVCIYMSGVPGTGKTAIFYEVLRKLKNSSHSKKLPSFQFIEINGMKVIDPSHSYTLVHQALFNKSVSAVQAQKNLQEYFVSTNKKQKRILILLDELDLLITQKQSVLYHFLEWAQHSLMVVAIANIMDLPERQLKKKVSSRLGWIRLDFHPYTEQQLVKILEQRLSPWPALFQVSAMEYLARKISTIHGDARRLLMVATRALDLAKAECLASHRSKKKPGPSTSPVSEKALLAFPVTISHIQKAWDHGQGMLTFLQTLPKQYKLILVHFLHAAHASTLPLMSLMDWMYEQCTMKNWDLNLTDDLIMTWLHRLMSCGLLFLDPQRGNVHLNISHQDVHLALKKDPDFSAWINTIRPSGLMVNFF